ncbi:MAG: magnesium/cobalt transporter CorA, partial [Pedobacter sp.]
INIYCYNKEELATLETDDIQTIISFREDYQDRFCWIDVRGLGSQDVLNTIQRHYNVNSLVMEDIVNTYQRPKCEEYDEYLFVVSRMMGLDRGLVLNNEQLSFICFDNLLMTFQEDYEDVLGPVRARLLKYTNTNMRNLGPSYLMYALMDTVLDNYFAIINRLGDEIDLVEEHIYQRPQKLLMYRLQGVKKTMLVLRRAAWPERDKFNELMRNQNALINDDVKVFIRDAYDHSIQIIDLIESYKETTTSLMDVYLSLISNKMNEIMKFLTIVSAIFIPLTFIAGVYGMNFAYENPRTGELLKNNMPELYEPNAYIYVLVFMLLVAAGQIWYFTKKGWFRD